jgi:hypothetical protein
VKYLGSPTTAARCSICTPQVSTGCNTVLQYRMYYHPATWQLHQQNFPRRPVEGQPRPFTTGRATDE